jgi:uncharacterized protein (TIGR03663 family)
MTTSEAKRGKATGARGREPGTQAAAPPAREESGRGWLWIGLSGAVLLFAFVLRFYHISLRPVHHDEAVNGVIAMGLLRAHVYKYNPTHYHGPSLYYFLWLAFKLDGWLTYSEGLSTAVIRGVTAFLGAATVGLLLSLRHYLGAWGALTAAALMAFSPGAVFVSRDCIHEAPFVFLTLAMVMALWRYYETASPAFLCLAAGWAGILCATKETWIFTAAVLPLAGLGVAGVVAWPVPDRRWQVFRTEVGRYLHWGEGRRAGRRILSWIGAFALFLAIYGAFFSSFGDNFPKGIYDSFATFRYWAHTGATDIVHNDFTYLYWLARAEFPTLVLGILGMGFALRRRNRFAMFCGFWALGMLAVYSLIPYKTGWLTLNILLPLAITGGYGVAEMGRQGPPSRRRWAPLAGIVAGLLAVSAGQAISFSFFRYDDDAVPYVFRDTRRQFPQLVEQIDRIARRAQGAETFITVLNHDPFPLIWYLRDYPNVHCWDFLAPDESEIVVATNRQAAGVQRGLGDRFVRVGDYLAFPAHLAEPYMVLFARRDLLP